MTDSTITRGTAAEYMAAIVLEGKAFRPYWTRDFDVYWADQMAKVEVKRVDISADQIGKKELHSCLTHNWDKHDYCMLMVYVDRKFDHCYLIPSCDITNRPSKSKSISLPKNWDNFQFRNRLYAMVTERGLVRA